MSEADRADDRYERSDVSGRFVLRFAVVFVIVATALAALAVGLSRALWPEPPPEAALRDAPPMRGPDLQANPAADLAAMRAEAQRRLDSYAWVDRERGVARIPIERAMELLVAREREGERP